MLQPSRAAWPDARGHAGTNSRALAAAALGLTRQSGGLGSPHPLFSSKYPARLLVRPPVSQPASLPASAPWRAAEPAGSKAALAPAKSVFHYALLKREVSLCASCPTTDWGLARRSVSARCLPHGWLCRCALPARVSARRRTEGSAAVSGQLGSASALLGIQWLALLPSFPRDTLLLGPRSPIPY